MNICVKLDAVFTEGFDLLAAGQQDFGALTAVKCTEHTKKQDISDPIYSPYCISWS